MTVMGLTRSPNAHFEGTAHYKGTELINASEEQLRRVRGAEIAMIFQDPMTSLNPVMKIGPQIVEQIQEHEALPDQQARERAVELLEKVGIPRARERIDNYPFEFSGGMRQRVMIALALSCNPSVLIADEPTTALDVTIQAQILQRMRELRDETGAAIILVTHDLGVVADIADRIAVMYSGRIVEEGTLDEIFYDPQHPYTWGLLGSIARVDRPRPERLPAIPGMPPSLSNRPEGCHFRPRSPHERQHERRRARRHRAPEGLLPDQAGVHRRSRGGASARGERRDAVGRRGRDGRAGGGVGLREDDAFPGRYAPDRPHRRVAPLSRRRHHQRRPQAARAAAPADADGLPGPVRVAEPAQASGADHRPAAPAARDAARGGGGEGARAAVAGGAGARAPEPLPARVLWRPAPANRRGTRARAGAEADRARRAGVGARRVGAGPDHQPARRPPGRVQAHVPVRCPRPVGRAARVRPDRGDVPREVDGGLAVRGAVHEADPPVHVRAPERDPDPGPRGKPSP